MAEEVLITVRVDKPKNQDELTKLTGQIIAQKNEIKQLETAVKTLSKAEGDNNELIKGATKNLEIKKQQLNQNVASQKALVNVINAEVKSLNALKAENVQLIRQRNALNIETEEGRAGIARLNSQIDGNNAKIRENSSALEKQKINIGNYGSALSGLSPALGGFVNGLQSATVAAKAFIATPIGLILAGIALAVAPLVSFFKDTAAGADAAAEEAGGFSLVMDILGDKVNAFGQEQATVFDAVLDSFFSLSPVLGSLKTQYDLLAEAGREYARALDELNDKQALFNVEAAFTQNEIAKLIIQSKDRTKTEAERLKILDEITQKEEELGKQRAAFAQAELSATLQRNEKRLEGVGIIQTAEESQLEFAKRAVGEIRESSLKQGDALADLLLKNLKNFADAEAESISILGKAENKRNELLDKAEEKDEKRREDEKKRKEKEDAEKRKQKEKDDEEAQEELEFQMEVQKEAQETEVENARITADEIIAQAKRKRDYQIRYEEETARAKVNLAGQLGMVLQQLAGKNKALAITGVLIERSAAIAQVISNTAIANAKAVKDFYITGGMPFVAINTASAVLSIASIIASATRSIGEIRGFATGGIVGDRGVAVTRSNGDNRLITAKSGEVILTNEQRARIGDRELGRAGVPGFATGGIVGNETRVAASRAEAQFDFNQMASLLNQVRTVLVLEDFEAKQSEVNGIQNKARIIG